MATARMARIASALLEVGILRDTEEAWAGSLEETVKLGIASYADECGGDDLSLGILGGLMVCYSDDVRKMRMFPQRWREEFLGESPEEYARLLAQVGYEGKDERDFLPGEGPVVGAFGLTTFEIARDCSVIGPRIVELMRIVGESGGWAVMDALQKAGEITGLVAGPAWGYEWAKAMAFDDEYTFEECQEMKLLHTEHFTRLLPTEAYAPAYRSTRRRLVWAKKRLESGKGIWCRQSASDAAWAMEVVKTALALAGELAWIDRRVKRRCAPASQGILSTSDKPTSQAVKQSYLNHADIDPRRRRFNHGGPWQSTCAFDPPAAPASVVRWSAGDQVARTYDDHMQNLEDEWKGMYVRICWAAGFDPDLPGTGPGTVRWAARSFRAALRIAPLCDKLIALLSEEDDLMDPTGVWPDSYHQIRLKEQQSVPIVPSVPVARPRTLVRLLAGGGVAQEFLEGFDGDDDADDEED